MSKSKNVVSYCDPISAQAGDEVRFMVSSLDGEAFDGQLVRLICADVSPNGHGYEEVEYDSEINRKYQGKYQPLRQGSSAEVPANKFFSELTGMRLEVAIYPTLIEGTRTIVSCGDDTGGFALEMRDGAICLIVAGTEGEPVELQSATIVRSRRWVRLIALYDAQSEVLSLSIDPLITSIGDQVTSKSWFGEKKAQANLGSREPLTFAARLHFGSRDQHFDGRLDECRLGSSPHAEPEVRWDFSKGIGSDRIHDVGPFKLDGKTLQLPARATPGINWTGKVHDWTVQPSQYGAIHFHSDDLSDAEWETSCALIVPETLPSGVYAMRFRTKKSEDYAVFFVSPRDQDVHADVAWLAPTVTYRAYANVRLALSADKIFGSGAEQEVPNDEFLIEHPECGLSCYEHHADGHGVANSSHRRPVLNMKPKGGVWSFTADTNVTAWLSKTNEAHDVITDDLVHEIGAGILDHYRVIVTGTHPEYWTTPMLDALEDWLARGGRLMVMGANGFYWRTGIHTSNPGAIEVRRAEDGTRAWISEPGEYIMETSGELGGMWRRIGRPPNRITGAGFAAQGFSSSGYYRRSDAWDNPRISFAVDGLSDSDLLGDFGNVGGGAAGQEIDRFDEALGSPSHSIVLASSEGHPPDMLLVKEEFAATGIPIPGVAARADVVFFETPNGGAVFTTGSIAWAASLAYNDYDNDVAKLSTNVLRRFKEDTPFPHPEGVTEPLGVPKHPDDIVSIW